MQKRIKRTLLGLGGVISIATLLGIGFEFTMRSQASQQYPAPGKLVDISGRKIQMDCRGIGSPTVVLQSGLDGLGSLSWAAVHDEIAKTTRVCAYSRSGILWSDPDSNDFNSQTVAEDLHNGLLRSGESGPWVMVGHSLGGPYAMMFTKLYPSEVLGLVFVDASHPDQVERAKALGIPSDISSSSPVLLWNLAATTGIMRLIGINPTPKQAPTNVKTIGQVFLPQTMGSLSKEILGIDQAIAAAGDFRRLGDRPLVVLTATRQLPLEQMVKESGLTPEQILRSRSLWKELQADEATWSSRSRHELVGDSSHYIHFDRPDVVIKAVNEVVLEVRKKIS